MPQIYLTGTGPDFRVKEIILPLECSLLQSCRFIKWIIASMNFNQQETGP